MTQICENEACRHENEVGTKFCVSCGQPFTMNTAPTPEAKAQCEHDNNGSGTFCIKCGEQYIKEPVTVSEPEVALTPTPEAEVEAEVTPTPEAEAEAEVAPTPTPEAESTPTPEQVEVPPSVVKAECEHDNNGSGTFCIKCGEQYIKESVQSEVPKSEPVQAAAPTPQAATPTTPVPNTKPHCKHDNGGSGTFCIKCGEKFIHGEAAAPNVKASSKQSKPKSASSTKTIIALIVAAAVIVFAVAGYWILGKMLSNKGELTSGLHKVVVSEDVDTFYDMLTIEDVSKEEQKAYKKYLEENDVSEMADAIVKSLNLLNDSDQLLARVATDHSEVVEFKIVKTKRFGLFESYEIQPIRFGVYAETNSDEIEITILGETKLLPLEEVDPIIELLPGAYDYTLSWDTEIGSVTQERTHYVWPSDAHLLDGTLSMYEVDLYGDWNYLINGKNIDLKKYAPEGRLVVPDGVEFELTATFKEDGVEYKSEPVRITDSVYLDFQFPKYEEKLEQETAKEEAKQETEVRIGTLIYDYLWIYSNGYVDSLNTVIATDSKFYNTQKKYLQGLNDKNTQANADDFKIEKIVENSNGTYTVTVNEWYTIYKPDASPKDVKQKSIYTVKRIDGSYYITGLKLG